MALVIRNLGTGTLTNTTAQTTGPLPGKSWLIENIILTNRDSAPRTMDLKLMNGAALTNGYATSGGSYIAAPGMTVPGLTTVVINDQITLQNPNGGTAQTLSIGVTGTAASPGIDVVVNGLERDL